LSTFVLVHGAWAGAWVWKQLRPLLAQSGHEVYSPSLSGQSERIHIGGPHINLMTHILDVKQLIEFEELNGIVLVGHSYGGMVITGVAEQIPDRIAHLVYLDAFLPDDGQSVEDLSPIRDPVVEDGWRVMSPFRPQANAEPPPIQRVFGHPLGTMQEKVRLSVPLEKHAFTLTYIKAMEPPRGNEGSNEAFWRAFDRTRSDPSWRTFEMPTTHNAQLTMPQELSQILLEVAK
jgi:pimeloyl-ACP methyl ester carboxylesterase